MHNNKREADGRCLEEVIGALGSGREAIVVAYVVKRQMTLTIDTL